MLNQERLLQLIRFCVVGGTCAVVDLSVVWTASHLLRPLTAVSLGFVTGILCHFLLNKFCVFRCDSRHYRRQLALYFLHTVLYWLTTMLIVSLVLSLFPVSAVVARLISIPPMTLFTFCSLRFMVFRKGRLRSSPIRRDGWSTVSGFQEVRTPGTEAYALQTDSEAS
jgi:putative flippase GtrA